MKIKDFLKLFENEDPETEIFQHTKDLWRDLDKDFELTQRFVSETELEKDRVDNYKYAKCQDAPIKILILL